MRDLAARSSAAPAFERRAARAELLAAEGGPARDALRFAAGLLRAQARASLDLEFAHEGRPLAGRLADDLDRVLERRPSLFGFVAQAAPAALAREARERADEQPLPSASRLSVYWSGEPEARGDYLSRALLRPYVETLAALGLAPDRLHRSGHCPFCGGAPGISSRRAPPETHGAQRYLGCALCGGEWPVNRVRCPACEEDDPDKLPSFQDGRHPLARVEACETCRRYVKSIDLTLDARPVPEVDDLGSISMDLWAGEQGYERIEPGLAGI